MTIPSFRQYLHENRQVFSEGWLSSIFAWIKKRISALFRALKFGDSQSISIGIPQFMEGADAPTTSPKALVGYYAEAVVAEVLAQHITDADGRLTAHSHPETFKTLRTTRRNKAIAAGAVLAEIARADEGGLSLGTQIWEDIRIEGEDFEFLTFDITYTGDSAKGVGKADIVLTVTKDSEAKVYDRIAASLKVYKTPQINLANTSFISLIRQLFYDVGHAPSGGTEEFLAQFIKDYGTAVRDDLEQLLKHQQIISREMGQGKTKEQARKLAKLTHPDVIAIIVRIFNAHYKQEKKRINARFLHLLGLDGDEEFYAAVGSGKGQRVLSSRRSEAFKTMLAQLRHSFVITVQRNGVTNNASVTLTGPRGAHIVSAVMTFADSGGTNAAGKTNLFVNLSKMF